MHSILAAVALATVAMAQNPTPITTDSVPSNPATRFLTETNSLGVVTGQPSVVTSEPSAVTSQPAPIVIPAGLSAPVVPLSYIPSSSAVAYGSSSVVPVASSGTASGTASGTSTGTATGTATTGSTGMSAGSASSTRTSSVPTGAAAAMAAAGPVGLSLVAGAAFAMLI
ncbi:hypothetical protein TMatcc_000426 [Talaromyces marneffei ATCC 18224]|uniref:GPI anchored protein n=2 Tax=Talaromyces marneffei TaxID=37727 RepID=B6QR41_TALMQ|nr:uncharacterized protein EYB26_003012 [Talaromyces marneffei]EEA20446.1 conserved hypothetical protein [Talaromyces marneffei ATCC 18224]KAE8549427.1 hypothetical protein EYB25_007948 [Talaromyces marneffei]QGA15355.1 hypothetical protein EYB26_003012 [Talaromyces marneffei]